MSNFVKHFAGTVLYQLGFYRERIPELEQQIKILKQQIKVMTENDVYLQTCRVDDCEYWWVEWEYGYNFDSDNPPYTTCLYCHISVCPNHTNDWSLTESKNLGVCPDCFDQQSLDYESREECKKAVEKYLLKY